MDIKRLTEVFFEMEEKYDLFNKKTLQNIYWWDIVRYFVYYEILYEKGIRKRAKLIKEPKNKKTQKIIYIFSLILNELTFLFRNKKKKYLFFMASRNIDKNGKNIDIISENIYKILKHDSIVIELYPNTNKKYYSYRNFLLKLNKKLKKRNKKEYDFGIDIDEIIKEEFKLKIQLNSKINEMILEYEIEFAYYHKLLKKIKPKLIFLVQNGIQKGMFTASNELNIPLVELQHGLTNKFQMAYSYSKKIDYRLLKTFPKYFFTFSEFWNKINYPVKEKISIGNDFYYKTKKSEKNLKKVLIIFANIYTVDLLELTKNISIKDKKTKYIVKLHPNQKNELQYIKNELKIFENIEIIYMENTVSELLDKSYAVILIQSTSVYEALQKKKKIIIYKKQDYETHSDVFFSENVYQVENENEVIEKMKRPYIDEELVFFEKFNKEKFLTCIKEIEDAK